MFRERSEQTICIRQFTGAGPSKPPTPGERLSSHLCKVLSLSIRLRQFYICDFFLKLLQGSPYLTQQNVIP